MQRVVLCCVVLWCRVARRGVAWRSVVQWRGSEWRGVAWRGAAWRGAVGFGAVVCGAVRCSATYLENATISATTIIHRRRGCHTLDLACLCNPCLLPLLGLLLLLLHEHLPNTRLDQGNHVVPLLPGRGLAIGAYLASTGARAMRMELVGS